MILSKSQLVNNIENEISDNSTGQISPYDIRHNLLDIIDSVHLLTGNQNLKALNFATPDSRNTKAGQFTLDKINLQGYSSVDNSAFGFGALRANYQSSHNTALGSHSLGCNIYGSHNVAAGYQSLGGNTLGHGNVGIGNYTLNNNKVGNFNIAIGHAAGYYATRETHSKLFIASHPIEDGYVCDNPLGSGLTPLVYGDLSANNLKFGIAVRSLHDFGTLQVSGAISPSENAKYDLGHNSVRFKNAYLYEGVNLPSGLSIHYLDGNIASSGDLVPSIDKAFTLGSPSKTWQEGHFENIYVSGEAIINKFTTIETCEYVQKTLFLAASGGIDTIDGGDAYGVFNDFSPESQVGHPCGYLPDEQLIDAGIIIKSSGNNYARDYKFTFLPPSSNLICQSNNPYSRATWNSNISLNIAEESYIRSDRLVGYDDLSLTIPSGCYGLFIKDDAIYLCEEKILNPNPVSSSGSIAGIGDINFIAVSGEQIEDYILTIAALESGVTVGQRFISGAKRRVKDALNENKDKLNGFEIKYIDNSNIQVVDGLIDRYVISSFHDTSEPINSFIVMKDNSEGLVGITNINPGSEGMLPKTIFNVRSINDSVARLAAENQGDTKAAVQLLGGSNCLDNGVELAYFNLSGIADVSMFKDSAKTSFIRMYENNTIGIFNGSGTSNSMLTMGDRYSPNAIVSMYFSSGTILPTAGYSKLFIKPNIQPNQDHSLYLLDGSGNLHDLVVNKFNVTDARAVYTDGNRNTFAGYESPDRRDDLQDSIDNTSYGYRSLYAIASGDYNTSFGSSAGSGLTTGSRNTIIGYRAAPLLTTQINNIVIGPEAYSQGKNSHNIIIGQSGVGNMTSDDYNFVLGSSSGVVLMQGKLGPTNASKQLSLPNDGKLYINDASNTDKLLLKTNVIEVIDGGGSDYAENQLYFRFTGNNSNDLLILDHNAAPLTNSASYEEPEEDRPSVELNGDLKLKGAIRFSDETSLSSASFLTNIEVLESGLNTANNNISILQSALSSLLVEGYCSSEIKAPANASMPTSGILTVKNSNWQNSHSVYITNRDITSTIHSGAYVIAIFINNEYRPLWISAKDIICECCNQ